MFLHCSNTTRIISPAAVWPCKVNTGQGLYRLSDKLKLMIPFSMISAISVLLICRQFIRQSAFAEYTRYCGCRSNASRRFGSFQRRIKNAKKTSSSKRRGRMLVLFFIEQNKVEIRKQWLDTGCSLNKFLIDFYRTFASHTFTYLCRSWKNNGQLPFTP